MSGIRSQVQSKENCEGQAGSPVSAVQSNHVAKQIGTTFEETIKPSRTTVGHIVRVSLFGASRDPPRTLVTHTARLQHEDGHRNRARAAVQGAVTSDPKRCKLVQRMPEPLFH